MRVICSFIFIGLLTSFTATAFANETIAPELECQKKVKMQGPANLSKSIAETSAIISWIKTITSKYDDEHAVWHRAQNKSVSCKKARGSQYFYCMISAEPCKKKQDKPKQTAENAPIKATENKTQ